MIFSSNSKDRSFIATLMCLGMLLLSSVGVRAEAPPLETPSTDEEIQTALTGGVPLGRWDEGLLFKGISPQPWLKSAANWFPDTEDVQPNEMRITFMGSSPLVRPGQAATSIFLELGNGDKFVFDLGEGAIANYIAGRVALNELKHVFLTHLHVDHYGALPYLWMFGTWAGGWHENLNVYGPSGRTPEYGTKVMVEGMRMMTGWHQKAFSIFPVGKGWDIKVHEFDFRDNGGVVYDRDGVKVIHWQRSHAMDGASGYRLDWNGLCFVWTGDGRPSKLDLKYAQGCDVYVTETQAELMSISSGVAGVPPFLGRYTIDTHHTVSFAAGYMASLIKPRLLMTTHMSFDTYSNAESVAEIRHHWKGPFHFGAPDGVVVNVTKEQIWVRDGIFPEFPNSKAPQFDFSNGQLVVPHPPTSRDEIQEAFVRENEIDPSLYYPEGYKPRLLFDWPVEGQLVVPLDKAPEKLRKGMGRSYELRQKNQKILKEQDSNLETKE